MFLFNAYEMITFINFIKEFYNSTKNHDSSNNENLDFYNAYN